MAQPSSLAIANSQVSTIYRLPSTVAAHVSGSVRRRLRQAISLPIRRVRSESTSSSSSDDGSSTKSSNSGANTPRLDGRGEELSMSVLTHGINALTVPNMVPSQREAAGINWASVAVGLSLSQSALSGLDSGMDPIIARTLLIDGVKYTLRGLPADLSERELRSLSLLVSSSDVNELQRTSEAAEDNQNLIRSSTARLVCCVISIFMLVVPLFASFLNRALEYERQHHLTEKTIQGTGQLARTAGTASLTIGDRLIKLSRTPLGAQCLVNASWVFQSILEGVGDGVDQTIKQRPNPRPVMANTVI